MSKLPTSVADHRDWLLRGVNHVVDQEIWVPHADPDGAAVALAVVGFQVAELPVVDSTGRVVTVDYEIGILYRRTWRANPLGGYAHFTEAIGTRRPATLTVRRTRIG